MRFLCLHGGGTNAEIMQAQFALLTYELGRDGHTFHFVNGNFNTKAAPGIASVYEGPYLEHFQSKRLSYKDMYSSPIQTKSKTAWTTEEYIRKLSQVQCIDGKSVSDACAYVQEIVNGSDGPFDGIIGFSQGASLAATYLIRKPRDAQLECAVFICATPAMDAEGTGFVLADEPHDTITIPTAHITGFQDSLRKAGLALYNICDPHTATHFEHNKGHLLPRDPETNKTLASIIRDVVRRAEGQREL
ncbi:MAG: hypothetical protein MMC33_005740 [Icmadophila ericetorum]|nr:hypothetical protein [Icmadophila ericetorum]